MTNLKLRVRALIQKDDKLLLVKEKGRDENWETPGGGVEENETIDQAFQREMKEETGLDLKKGNILDIYLMQFPNGDKHLHLIFDTYLIRDNPNPTEDIDIKWFTKDEIRKLLLKNQVDEHDRNIFKRFLDNDFDKWNLVTGPVIAVKKDNKFLLLQRAEDETYPGLWEFPAGGLEFFENLEDAALRELKEESGLIAEHAKYLGYHERIDNKLKKHVVAHDFLVTDFKGKIKLSHEHQDFKWVTIEEIKKMKVGKEIGDDTINLLKKLSLIK